MKELPIAYCVKCMDEWQKCDSETINVMYDGGKWKEVNPTEIYNEEPSFLFTKLKKEVCAKHEIFRR